MRRTAASALRWRSCRRPSLLRLALFVGAGCAWLSPLGTGASAAAQPHSPLSSATPAGTALQNGDFEGQNPVTSGWEVAVYGAAPTMVRDTESHGGAGALRISAAAPSDTALGQEIKLTPGRAYRLTGWIRTSGLHPTTASVFGTLQVQMPGGRGVIATGPNHEGDTPWTEVTVPFIPPAGGVTRLCLFFAGFGRATGTAWFDDITVQPMELAMEPLIVTNRPLNGGVISPFQTGQFIEYLCDLVPGMWAEKLYDGSFEGLSPYKFVYLKETDFKEKPWYPAGATNRAEFTLDSTTQVSGAVSQRIHVLDGAPCTVGMAQDGIAVQRGEACVFSCYFKKDPAAGTVRVRLTGASGVLAAAELQPGANWTKLSARLVPSGTDSAATLTIDFRGPGTLWLDNASLMPEKTVGGWRPDVVEALRALKPGIIRFGGSALDDGNLGDFEWLDTIGDPDHRKPFRAWGGLQPTGPGLEEIVQLCYAVDAEPLLCVRVTDRKPEDAAAEVEYFNGAVTTPMGALRARNGHPQPYGIRYWQIGNERSGEAYERLLPGFCQAVKKADPSIHLMSSYPTPGVLKAAGQWLDTVCPHHYGCADLQAMEEDFARIRRMIAEDAPGRDIKIAVTEWNTTGGDAGPRRAMLWTLENALACSRYQNLLHRESDRVEIANRSNLTNSFCSGILQTDNHRLYKTPTYYAQQLYATLSGTTALAIDSAVPAAFSPDVSATLSTDGQTVTLFAVNDGAAPMSRTLDLGAFGSGGGTLETWTLADREAAGEPDVTNSFSDPDRIVSVHKTVHESGDRFSYHFPPLSLTVLRWKVRIRG